jgi:hypothetical protein
MKKWIISILIITVLIVGSIYIFIPSKLTVSSFRYVKEYHNGLVRFITDSTKFSAFLSANTEKNDEGFSYNGVQYKIYKPYSDFIQIEIKSGNIQTISNLFPVNIYRDSPAIQWMVEYNAGFTPWGRILSYREAIKIKESISGLLDSMKNYADNTVNIYGFPIEEIALKKDTIVLSTYLKTNTYPSVTDIYKQVQKLNDYAVAQKANADDVPMISVKQIDSLHFETMIGLPINKDIQKSKDILVKHMPFNGKMFVTVVNGGNYSIQNGFKAMDLFHQDSKRPMMAISYQLMITDRSKETDTTKWVTQLYHPVNN